MMLRFHTPIFTTNVTRISSRHGGTAAGVYVQQAAALSGRGSHPDASSVTNPTVANTAAANSNPPASGLRSAVGAATAAAAAAATAASFAANLVNTTADDESSPTAEAVGSTDASVAAAAEAGGSGVSTDGEGAAAVGHHPQPALAIIIQWIRSLMFKDANASGDGDADSDGDGGGDGGD